MLVNADSLEAILQNQVTVACWECEAPAPQFVEAPIPVASQQHRSVRLCQSCYVSCYLPLAADVDKSA
jgi:hypothetical protein